MKLEKNNKYNNLKVMGLSTILLGGIILGGCEKENNTIEPTPTEIIEVTPMPTPVVTPKPTPTPMPTPMPTMKPNPVLTDEEVIEKFGVLEPNTIAGHDMIFVMEYVTNETNKISFVWISDVPNEEGTYDIYNLFTEETIFVVDHKTLYKMFETWNDSLVTVANEKLGDAKFVRMNVLPRLRQHLEKNNIKIPNSEYDSIIDDETLKNKSTILEYAKMYSTVIPEEYWMTKEILNYTSDLVKVK